MGTGQLDEFRARILERKPLRIRGGGSKDFYGGPLTGDILDTRAHAGIVSYEPTELVVTARCGTPLAELESALAARRRARVVSDPERRARLLLRCSHRRRWPCAGDATRSDWSVIFVMRHESP